MLRIPVAMLTLMLSISWLAAADSDDLVKQKAAAEENWKKIGMKSKTIVETPELLIYSTLPEAKLKTLSETAQRTVTTAKTALGFEKDEAPFAGKLTLYVFTDYADLKDFIRRVEQRRPEANTAYTFALRGATPLVALSPGSGAKLNDADLTMAASTMAGAAVLNKKLGVAANGTLPEWVLKGFGRAATIRGEKSEAKVSAHRGKVKSVVLATGTKAIYAPQIWDGAPIAESDLAAASLVEYLAFGPPAEKFLPFCRALRTVGDDGATPTITMGLTAAEWTAEGIDAGWKQWVLKGK